MVFPLESARHYDAGDFHPIYIGVFFFNQGRYRIINQLGLETYSTVWLVTDLHSNCFVTLKVLSAYSSTVSSEMYISQYLQQQQAQPDSHPGKAHVIHILDTFVIHGPNGTHHYIVTELLGIDISVITLSVNHVEHIPVPLDAPRMVAAQVALGIAYLHKCGIVHGDLHTGNVHFYTLELENASLADIKRIYGDSFIHSVRCKDNITPPLHYPTTIAYQRERYHEDDVCLSRYADIHAKLCNFGESSFYASNRQPDKPLTSKMPFELQAPEIIFHDMVCPSPSMDIWALGTLMYMILNSNHHPFAFYYDNDDMLRYMVYILGRFPDNWWTAWGKRAEYFDENGLCREHKRMVPFASIDIKAGQNISADKVDAFRSLLYKMFRYVSEERIDAEEVVRLIPSGWKKRNVKHVTGNGRARG
ncbi:kinase-like domain-containing protein [Cyathus striatus]|nr:kinase-like domain-containing protein [Cyathus striatus]